MNGKSTDKHLVNSKAPGKTLGAFVIFAEVTDTNLSGLKKYYNLGSKAYDLYNTGQTLKSLKGVKIDVNDPQATMQSYMQSKGVDIDFNNPESITEESLDKLGLPDQPSLLEKVYGEAKNLFPGIQTYEDKANVMLDDAKDKALDIVKTNELTKPIYDKAMAKAEAVKSLATDTVKEMVYAKASEQFSESELELIKKYM